MQTVTMLIPLSEKIEEAEKMELTKIWLDGSKKIKTTTTRNKEKVNEVVNFIKSAHLIEDYACNPSTPKYVITFYRENKKEVIGEVRTRANILQVDENIAYVPSDNFVQTLDNLLAGCRARVMNITPKR